ncbi:hypothetical protein [Azospirillum sp. sgz302134]
MFSALPPRAWRFLGLAGLIGAGNAYASTLAAAAFLGVAGAERLPLYYGLFAVLSVPVSLVLSTVVHRWPRARLLGWVLAGLAVAMLAAMLAGTGIAALDDGGVLASPLALARYLAVSLLELMAYSLFYLLFAERFSAAEATRLNAPLATAMAVGATMGAGLVAVASTVAPSSMAPPSMAPLGGVLILLVTLAALRRIGRGAAPPPAGDEPAEDSVAAGLARLPELWRCHPMAPLLAASLFLNIFLQTLAEYLAFSVYASRFPDEQALGGFLGAVTMALNLLSMVLPLLVTHPLMRRPGTALNRLYPGLTFLSFAVLAADFRLPTAILAHVNYEACHAAIDHPVFTLNYYALPPGPARRLRVVNDGAVYPAALAVAGLLLQVLQGVATPLQTALLGGGVSLIFFWLGGALDRHHRATHQRE